MNDIVIQALKQLNETRFLDVTVEKVASRVVIVAIILGIIFYLINLGFNYIKTGVSKLSGKDGGYFIDFEELMRTLGILTLICLYFPVMTAVTQLCDFAYDMTKPNQAKYDNLVKSFKSINEDAKLFSSNNREEKLKQIVRDFESGKDTKITRETYNYSIRELKKLNAAKGKNVTTGNDPQSINAAKDNGFNWSSFDPVRWLADVVVVGLLELLSELAKGIVFGVTKIFLKFLYCTGALALAFSIIPFMRRQGEIWFCKFISTYFVFVTFNILDHFLAATFDNGTPHFGDGAAQISTFGSSYITYNLVLIIAYFSAFKITSWYVGHSDVGKAVSKGAGFVGDTAKLLFMMKSGGTSKVASTVGNVVAEAGKTAQNSGSAFQK